MQRSNSAKYSFLASLSRSLVLYSAGIPELRTSHCGKKSVVVRFLPQSVVATIHQGVFTSFGTTSMASLPAVARPEGVPFGLALLASIRGLLASSTTFGRLKCRITTPSIVSTWNSRRKGGSYFYSFLSCRLSERKYHRIQFRATASGSHDTNGQHCGSGGLAEFA